MPPFGTMSKTDAVEFDEHKDGDWLNPIAMSYLKDAVEKRASTVVLRGDRFNITYGFKRTYPASNETVESIRLTPADGGFVPMGYVSMKKILEFDFEKA
jgi:hypothetical protein